MSIDNTINNEKKPNLFLRILLLILVLAVIAGVLLYIKFGIQIPKLAAQGQAPPPAISVTIATSQQAKWKNHLTAIGSLVSSQGIDITSEVSGVVKSLNFKSGDEIESGTLLLSLNDETEVAALNTANAQYESAYNQYKRSLKLKNKKFVTENDLDVQRLAANSANSQVQMSKAQLDKRNIHVPFSGKLGIRNVDLGDYVSPGTKFVTLQALDTLYLDFTLPEQNFKQLAVGQKISFSVRSYPDQKFAGLVQAWDPNLDESTRNIKVRAQVNNSDRLLAPGMFAQIEVEGAQLKNVITIPETAIFYNIYGEAVYVLEDSKNIDSVKTDEALDDVSQDMGASSNEPEIFVLAAKQVKVLYREDGVAGVYEGLIEGEQVVTSGQLKLYPSLKVKIVDDVPEFDSSQSAASQASE